MKINKLVASLLAVSLLAFPVVQVSADENISLTVNGKSVETQVPPTIIDGRTMVPVRDIFEACGAKVNWDANTKTITGEKGNTTVVMQIDSNMLFINEKVTEMDATPVIIDGRTLAPARYVAESFGGIVDWNAEDKVVMIDVDDSDEDVTETTTEETTVTEETTEVTTVTETTEETTVTEETTEVTTVTETTEATTVTETTTVAEPSDMIVNAVRSDLQKAMGTYSLGSYATAGKFKTTVMKQTTDNWASMATTAVDKKYVAANKTLYYRINNCYKVIDELYATKKYSSKLSDLRNIMAEYKTKANDIINESFKTRNADEINKISNEIATFVNNMRTEVKVLADNT